MLLLPQMVDPLQMARLVAVLVVVARHSQVLRLALEAMAATAIAWSWSGNMSIHAFVSQNNSIVVVVEY